MLIHLHHHLLPFWQRKLNTSSPPRVKKLCYIIFCYFRNVGFICGAIPGVLIILTIWDIDILQIDHVFTVSSILATISLAAK